MMGWILSSWALILTVLFLRRLLKGKISQRLQYALWALVLVRLLVPVSFASSQFSVQNLAQRMELQPGIKTVMEAAREPIRFESEGYAVEKIGGKSWLMTDTYYMAPSDALNEPYSWEDLFRMVWMAGALATSGFMLTCNAIFCRKVRRGRRTLDVPQAGLPVYVSEQVHAPCLVGIFRPGIYLTAEAAADETVLRHVLRHEQTHFHHCDHLIGVLRCLALALHWYDPLVWYAARVSKWDAELACDEGALARLGEEDRVGYGRTLLALTCGRKRSFDVMLTTTAMTGSGKSLKERIRRIAEKPKMTAFTLVAVILAALMAVGCTFTGAVERGEQTEQTDEELLEFFVQAETSEEIAQALERFVRRSVENDGGVMLVQMSDDIGYGYGLSAERCEEVAGSFAQYRWEEVDCQPEGIENAEDVLSMELASDRAMCTIKIDPQDEGCLWVSAFFFEEDVDHSRMFRAKPKDVAPSLYEVLLNLYSQQKEDTEQTITETQVSGEPLEEEIVQWWMGLDEATAMTEEELQECKVYLQWFDWTLIEDWDASMEPTGESIVIMQAKEEIEFFDSGDLVRYTSPSGSAYYSLTPQSEEIRPIWDIMRTMYEHRGQ